MKNKDIFKLQRPVAGGDEILIYNRSRNVELLLPPTPQLLAYFGDELKIYAVGEVKDGAFYFSHSLPSGHQDW